MHRFIWGCVLAGCFLAVSSSAQAFDCAKAYLPVDFVICSDPAVFQANEAHEKAWYETRARLTDEEKQELLADQRRWLKKYPPRCGIPARGKRLAVISKDEQLCVTKALEERRDFLEQYHRFPIETQSSTQTAAQPLEGQASTSPITGDGQAAGKFSQIKQVDFFDFTYPTGPADCSNPPPHGRKTVTLKKGEFMEKSTESALNNSQSIDLVR
jgi:uncharacterized protein YecT (DUF1311 family)